MWDSAARRETARATRWAVLVVAGRRGGDGRALAIGVAIRMRPRMGTI
jgi:hypothetical protein